MPALTAPAPSVTAGLRTCSLRRTGWIHQLIWFQLMTPQDRTQVSERHTYVLLDGLRGVAALAVAVLHMPRVFGGYTVPNAHLAVDFFLQLSGFIVAYAYAKRIAEGMRFRDFAWLRFNRLYPAYILGFLLGLIVAVAALAFGGSGLSVDWTPARLMCTALPNAVMLPQAFCGGLLFPLNPPMWSIFYELLINFAFFFCAVFLAVWRRSLILALIFLIALVAMTSPSTLDVGYSWATFAGGVARMAFAFLVGIAIYCLHIRPRGKSSSMAVVLTVALTVALNYQGESYMYEIIMVTIGFPALIVLGAMFNPSHGGLAWIFTQLGAVSYVLYVIHKPLYQLVYAAILKVAPDTVPMLGAVLGAALLIFITLVAWLLARYYEPRARRILNRMQPRLSERGANSRRINA